MDPGNEVFWNSGFFGEGGPDLEGLVEGGDDVFRLAGFDVGRAGGGEEVLFCELVSFAVEGHLVTAGPGSVGIVGVGDIVSGGEVPGAAAVHEEGDVFGVVVLIAGENVEDGAAEELGEVGLGEAGASGELKGLLIYEEFKADGVVCTAR